MRLSLEKRFWAKVNKQGPRQPHMKTRCWVWTAARDHHGYGFVGVGGRGRISRAHRVVFLLRDGALPTLCVLHRCDNPSCVRPSHLFLGTKRDNSRDMFSKGRTRRDGEYNGRAFVTWKIVRELRRRYSTGHYTQHALGRMYGLKLSHVNSIIRKQSWPERGKQ